MADLDPNKKLNDKRMQIEANSIKLNIERLELRLMEIDAEKIKIAENIESSNKRIAEIELILGA
jgi:hypothetical protein